MIKIGRKTEILPTNENTIGTTDGACHVCHERFECEFDHIPDGWGLIGVSGKDNYPATNYYCFICSKSCHQILKERENYGNDGTIKEVIHA